MGRVIAPRPRSFPHLVVHWESLFWYFYSFFYDSLNLLYPYRELLEEVVNALGVLKPRANVLDAGCGTGNLLAKMEQELNGVRLLGIDFSEGMLGRARKKAKRSYVWQANLDQPLTFAPKSLDAVTLINVLYSLPRPIWTLSEIARVLKPNGVLVVVNPNQNASQFEIFAHHLQKAFRKKDMGGIVKTAAAFVSLAGVALCNVVIEKKGRGKKYHFLKRQDLEYLLTSAGFDTMEPRLVYAKQDFLIIARKRGRYEAPTGGAVSLHQSHS